jgi:hypothetical protein
MVDMFKIMKDRITNVRKKSGLSQGQLENDF